MSTHVHTQPCGQPFAAPNQQPCGQPSAAICKATTLNPASNPHTDTPCTRRTATISLAAPSIGRLSTSQCHKHHDLSDAVDHTVTQVGQLQTISNRATDDWSLQRNQHQTQGPAHLWQSPPSFLPLSASLPPFLPLPPSRHRFPPPSPCLVKSLKGCCRFNGSSGVPSRQQIGAAHHTPSVQVPGAGHAFIKTALDASKPYCKHPPAHKTSCPSLRFR